MLLKLALPTVTAQLINMLYNIVDRIYIGHIPVIGEAALTVVGVCMPLIMIVTAFAAFTAYGGAPEGIHFYGTGPTRIGGKDDGELLCGSVYHLRSPDSGAVDLEPGFPYGFRGQ